MVFVSHKRREHGAGLKFRYFGVWSEKIKKTKIPRNVEDLAGSKRK